MVRTIKYVIMYIVLILVVASRLKVLGSLDHLGLVYLQNEETSGMKQLSYNWSGFEGSIVHFFALCLLFVLVIYDRIFAKINFSFFILNCFILSFSLFAFEETLIRILAISILSICLIKVLDFTNPKRIGSEG
jgi:hypothetical protein